MKNKKGFILPSVILVFVFLALVIPMIVKWVESDTRIAVKDQRSSVAFNLAEAAVDRGYWKIKSSTATSAAAAAGTAIAGYDFDVTYGDVPGGTYRVQISSVGYRTIKIVGEGRDRSTSETRAISAVFVSQSVNSPLLSSGNLGFKKGLIVFWGAIMTQGDIALDPVLADHYFPRKYSKGVVTGQGSWLRDTNGLTPPNTDDAEWWSDYQYVPELPRPNFEVLRASAAATHTLNVYGCKNSANYTDSATGATVAGAAPWDGRSK